jgi:nucleoside-diphosphate-sugar epimerase
MRSTPRHRRALVTGCAGFLGSHLSERLVASGTEVLGLDCFTSYYSRADKERNLERLNHEALFDFRPVDLSTDDLTGLLDGVDIVIHLAAEPGVRASFGFGFEAYLRNNVLATQRLLEEAVKSPVASFTYASSSSVYGDSATFPTSERAERRPISPYGTTKVATEELAGVYHRCFGVPVTGLRYFTAYGPRQRPDMAFTRFLTRALAAEPLPVFGDGRQVRDFTYVTDVVEATIKATERGKAGAVYNIGGGVPAQLREALSVIEEHIGRPLAIARQPARVGDPARTACDGSLAERELGFVPTVGLREGISAQLEWLQSTPGRIPDVGEPVHV